MRQKGSRLGLFSKRGFALRSVTSILIIALVTLFFFDGCTYRRLLKTYSVETENIKYRKTRPHFVSLEAIESSLSIYRGEVTFTIRQSARTREKGKEFVKKYSYQNKHYFMPNLSAAINDEDYEKLLLYYPLVTSGLILGAAYGWRIAFLFILTPTTLDVVSSIFYAPWGGMSGRESIKEGQRYYSDWTLDHIYVETLPLNDCAVELSIPTMGHNTTDKTDNAGQVMVDLRRYLPIEPRELLVYCKLKDPDGNWHEGKHVISERESAQLIAKFVD